MLLHRKCLINQYWGYFYKKLKLLTQRMARSCCISKRWQYWEMLKIHSPYGFKNQGSLLNLTLCVCNQGETEYFIAVVIKGRNLSSTKLIIFYLSMLEGRQSQAKIAVVMRTFRCYLTNTFLFLKKRMHNCLAKHIWTSANWDFVCKLEADGNFYQAVPSQEQILKIRTFLVVEITSELEHYSVINETVPYISEGISCIYIQIKHAKMEKKIISHDFKYALSDGECSLTLKWCLLTFQLNPCRIS